MPGTLLSGKCPYKDDSQTVIKFHEDVEVGHPGVCFRCYRRYHVAEKTATEVVLSADE
jgi:hypothetical protein